MSDQAFYRLTRFESLLDLIIRVRALTGSRNGPSSGLFVGLDGIEPSASALSELGKGLVRRLVCLLNCPFVPRGAT
jgi:hypothetical protein